jgi:primosomal protein N'
MIAEVYPILKLPRKCSYFDYDLRLDSPVAPGDLVRVPFKGREVLGIIKAVKNTSDAKKLIKVNSLAKTGYISAADLARYERLAECLAQSVSSILHTIFPGKFFEGTIPFVYPRRDAHIGALDIPILEHCLSEIALNKSVAICGDKDIAFALAHVLRRKRPGQMLVLLPRERDAELLADYVKLGDACALLHGHTLPKQRSQIIEGWRTGHIQTLIGTRLASLLPAHSLDNILVLESGNEEHANERRNPRFDAREAAKLLAHQHAAHMVWFDSVPRLEEVMSSQLLLTHGQIPDGVIVNQGLAEELSNELLLSQSLLLGLEKALQSQKKVLLFLNRKGVAKRLQCGQCGHVPLCGTCGHVPAVRHEDLVCANCQTEMWIPAACPACGKPKLALRGVGGAKIISTLQKLFPTASLGRLEKNGVVNPEADIVVATEYFFSSYRLPFAPKHFGLVADLAADLSLHAGDFRGAEDTARKLHRLINFGQRQGAEVIIQTWLPDVLRPMLELTTFTAAELDVRKHYRLPPAQARYLVEGASLEDLPLELQTQATERDETIELTSDHPLDILPYLRLLPDTLKIHYDGPYA